MFEREPSDFEESPSEAGSDTEAQIAEAPIDLNVDDIDNFPEDTAEDSDQGPAFLNMMNKSGWRSDEDSSFSDSGSDHRSTPTVDSTGNIPARYRSYLSISTAIVIFLLGIYVGT